MASITDSIRKSLILLIGIFAVCLIYSPVSVFSATIFDDSIDADTLKPGQIHELMGRAKAEALGRQRAAAPEAIRYTYDQTDFDVDFYRVEIVIDIPGEEITGKVTTVAHSLIPDLANIEIDLDDVLLVDNVNSGETGLNFSHLNDRVTIELGQAYSEDEEFSFTIEYHGQPQAAGLDGFSFGYHGDSPIVSSLSEPYMSRTWWPCKDRNDDKADSMDIFITCSTDLFCASNGTLIDTVRNGDDTWTFNYEVRYPIVTYLFSVAISAYSIWTDWYHYIPGDSMAIVNHVYPELLTYSQELNHWGATPYALSVFAGLFGEYPFIDEKYGHANFQWGGGMEHQTCTSMGGSSFGFSEPVVVHELAHQWWGDMITCNNWHEIWLNEGFASYSEALYYEVKDGTTAYHNYIYDMATSTGGTKDGTIYVYDTTNVWNIFSSIVYDKAACVLHMLRHVVGDEDFFNILTAYYNSSYKYSDATTEQFKNLCEAVSGEELDYFFDEWIYGTLRPDYNYSYFIEQDLTDGRYWTYLRIKQTQTSPPQVFTMPIDIVLNYSPTSAETLTIFNDCRDSVYILKTDQMPLNALFDPLGWVLRYSTKKSFFGLIPFSLDAGIQYAEYEDTIIARGGDGQILYNIISGELPPGLQLDGGTGIIDGIPTDFGEYTIRVRASDALSAAVDTADYNLTVMAYEGIPGDADMNHVVDILDIIYLINYLYKSGPVPNNPLMADPNDDCKINILDIVFLINYLYKNGPEPVEGCATI